MSTAYEKQSFTDGVVLEADHLNHMEEGIAAAMQAAYDNDGDSAYEIAVANGFVGTQEEWLAYLKGKDGKDGLDGEDGEDGEDGTGIVSVERTSGTGEPGTTDTYTMHLSDGSDYQFHVYNGADGKSSDLEYASDEDVISLLDEDT